MAVVRSSNHQYLGGAAGAAAADYDHGFHGTHASWGHAPRMYARCQRCAAGFTVAPGAWQCRPQQCPTPSYYPEPSGLVEYPEPVRYRDSRYVFWGDTIAFSDNELWRENVMQLPFFPYCALGTAEQAFTPRGAARTGPARCAFGHASRPGHDALTEGCHAEDLVELGDFGVNQSLVHAVVRGNSGASTSHSFAVQEAGGPPSLAVAGASAPRGGAAAGGRESALWGAAVEETHPHVTSPFLAAAGAASAAMAAPSEPFRQMWQAHVYAEQSGATSLLSTAGSSDALTTASAHAPGPGGGTAGSVGLRHPVVKVEAGYADPEDRRANWTKVLAGAVYDENFALGQNA